MNKSRTWGGVGVAMLVSAVACSGSQLNSVGDDNSAGSGGSANPVAGGSAGSPAGVATGGTNIHIGGGGDGAVPPIGVGGTGGLVIEPPPDSAGAAGMNDGGPCSGCQLITTGDIRGVAVNSDHVYWIDFGTKDDFGNYNGDGRLLARPLAGGDTVTLASSLNEPQSVALSDGQAYIFEGDTAHSSSIVRLPLQGGTVDAIATLASNPAEVSTYSIFAYVPSHMYWVWNQELYRIAEPADALIEPVVATSGVVSVVGSDTLLYFEDDTGIYSVDLTNAAPIRLSDSTQAGGTTLLTIQQVDGGYLYANEDQLRSSPLTAYLTRMPIGGGAWKRVGISTDGSYGQAVVAGNTFFIDPQSLNGTDRILKGTLGSTAALTLLTNGNPFKAWTWSSASIFLVDDIGLYQLPLATP